MSLREAKEKLSNEELQDRLVKVRDMAFDGRAITHIQMETGLKTSEVRNMIAAMRREGMKIPKFKSIRAQAAIINSWKKDRPELFKK